MTRTVLSVTYAGRLTSSRGGGGRGGGGGRSGLRSPWQCRPRDREKEGGYFRRVEKGRRVLKEEQGCLGW